MTKFDKAGAAVISGAVTTVFMTFSPDVDPEVVAAIGALITAGLVWLVPNKR